MQPTRSMLAIGLLLVSTAALTWQPEAGGLVLHDKEEALLYGVWYRPGSVHYSESTTPPSSWYDSVQVYPHFPVQTFVNSGAERGDRTVVATSISQGFAQRTVAASKDAVLWAFRDELNGTLASVVVGLRNSHGPVGGSVQAPGSRGVFELPPKSVAYAALVFRGLPGNVLVTFDDYSISGGDGSGIWREIAENATANPKSIAVSASTEASGNGAAGPGVIEMATKVSTAGSGAFLVSGGGSNAAESFAAAVIISPMSEGFRLKVAPPRRRRAGALEH